MRLIATSFVTVDGVMEGPGFDEHRDGRNAWALRVQDKETEQYNIDLVRGADAILVGRTTYQIWAAFWPTAEGGDQWLSRRMNEIPKYVVSNTMERADWNNTTILRGDVAGEITRLKEQPGGELVMYGSADLLAELMKHNLVDEYRLLLYPLVLGSGKHLFRDRIDTQYLRLTQSRVFSSGVVLLVYEPEAAAPDSQFVEEYTWTDEQVRSLQAAQNADRILATVLFTDIVESTAKAAEVGDRALAPAHGPAPPDGAGGGAPMDGPAHREHRRRDHGHLRHANPRAALRLRAARRDSRAGPRDACRHPHR